MILMGLVGIKLIIFTTIRFLPYGENIPYKPGARSRLQREMKRQVLMF